ncbi:MAG: hypothetical protein GAK28_01788 [Luteibacter sp.]|uniref:hypothetical protein n=1 Tax=Luteibacter sp. TaxID=1886636 RepID=UPI001384CB29|nr:hypothetical protein [Luteibacter sp.]KAF1007446.1 MAG: hypothetical protein GAK28_01788 [Luteibacter sp.]
MSTDTPLDDYNRMLIEQITTRAQQGFMANLTAPQYVVVHTGVDRVLTILSARSLADDQHPVFGPKPFADCIHYINQQLVVGPGKPAPSPQTPDDGSHHP